MGNRTGGEEGSGNRGRRETEGDEGGEREIERGRRREGERQR